MKFESRYLKKYNPNPKGKKTSDCAIRALCALTGDSWNNVYNALCKIGFELKTMPNDMEAVEKYLTINGYKKSVIKVKKGTHRPMVWQMAMVSENCVAYTPILCRVANHIVTVHDGQILDSWDSSDCCLYSYWTQTGELTQDDIKQLI